MKILIAMFALALTAIAAQPERPRLTVEQDGYWWRLSWTDMPDETYYTVMVSTNEQRGWTPWAWNQSVEADCLAADVYQFPSGDHVTWKFKVRAMYASSWIESNEVTIKANFHKP